MEVSRALLLLAVTLSPVACLRPLDHSPFIEQATEAISQFAHGFEAAEKPWFCHDLDCPKYKVLNHSKGYETREYEKGRWASTVVQGLFYTPAVTTGFKRLFDYISGENANSTKIPMTAPVLTAISPGDGPFCKSNFTVSFFVPFEFQESTPQPNNKDVFLLTTPKNKVYVSQFGGYLIDDLTLGLKVKALKRDLLDDGVKFEEGMYFSASYDPPFRVQHRHNEIIFAEETFTQVARS